MIPGESSSSKSPALVVILDLELLCALDLDFRERPLTSVPSRSPLTRIHWRERVIPGVFALFARLRPSIRLMSALLLYFLVVYFFLRRKEKKVEVEGS